MNINDFCKKQNTYYFISQDNMDGVILKPRVPQNYLTKYGFEDSTTPRICVSTSISGCLYGMSRNCYNQEFYVHELTSNNVIVPSISQVPDSNITNERWILEPCTAKLIGKIICGKSTNGKKFKYGKKSAVLYGWKYSWIYHK